MTYKCKIYSKKRHYKMHTRKKWKGFMNYVTPYFISYRVTSVNINGNSSQWNMITGMLMYCISDVTIQLTQHSSNDPILFAPSPFWTVVASSVCTSPWFWWLDGSCVCFSPVPPLRWCTRSFPVWTISWICAWTFTWCGKARTTEWRSTCSPNWSFYTGPPKLSSNGPN